MLACCVLLHHAFITNYIIPISLCPALIQSFNQIQICPLHCSFFPLSVQRSYRALIDYQISPPILSIAALFITFQIPYNAWLCAQDKQVVTKRFRSPYPMPLDGLNIDYMGNQMPLRHL